jgi:hypothetical protein
MLQFFKWQKNELRTTKKVKKNLIIWETRHVRIYWWKLKENVFVSLIIIKIIIIIIIIINVIITIMLISDTYCDVYEGYVTNKMSSSSDDGIY